MRRATVTETELQKAEIKRLSHTQKTSYSQKVLQKSAESVKKNPVLTMVFLGNIILLKIHINS